MLTKLCTLLMSIERNFILKKGESTVDLEHAKNEAKSDKEERSLLFKAASDLAETLKKRG
jgi:hypothetical protein